MSNSMPSSIRVKDPLSDVTRKERRTLLGACVIAYTIVKTGLVPSKIAAFGIDFTPTDQKSILSILSLIIFYFLIAFVIYSISDFTAWRLDFYNCILERIKDRKTREQDKRIGNKLSLSDIDNYVYNQMERYRGFRYLGITSRLISFFRAIFDLILPIIIGIYTIHTISSTELNPKITITEMNKKINIQSNKNIDSLKVYNK
jgi:hypothetical protein